METLVEKVMTRQVYTLPPDASFQEAVALMLNQRISSIPIVEKETGKLLGLLREEDLIIKDKKLHLPFFLTFLGGIFPLNADQFEEELQKAVAVDVRGMMNPSPVSVGPDQPLSDVVTLMSDHHLKSVPVVDRENRLVGIISQRDIISNLAQR